jgi:hypothetical protein
MRTKAWPALAVLTLRSQSSAVGQHSLEPVEIASDNVWPLVGHESCQKLPHSLAIVLAREQRYLLKSGPAQESQSTPDGDGHDQYRRAKSGYPVVAYAA